MPWSVIKSTYTIPELKYKDVTATGTVVGTGQFILLNGLNLGTSASTRIGRQIVIKKIHMKYDPIGAFASQTPTFPMTYIRAMIIFDMQPNGVAPTASDLLEDSTTGNQAVSSTAMRYSSRFKILSDKRWVLNNQISATDSPTFHEKYDEVFMNCNLKVIYSNSNNGDESDIETGALWLFLTTDSINAANNPAMQFYNRIRWSDN